MRRTGASLRFLVEIRCRCGAAVLDDARTGINAHQAEEQPPEDQVAGVMKQPRGSVGDQPISECAGG